MKTYSNPSKGFFLSLSSKINFAYRFFAVIVTLVLSFTFLQSFGQLTELGTDDYRISTTGGLGDANFDASEAAIAYNQTDDTWLVVWHADDNVSPQVDNEFEIFGQLISATGTLVGSPLKITAHGADGDATFDAYLPDVAWNSVDNEFLVVYRGDQSVSSDWAIFGQRVNATATALTGGPFVVSTIGNGNSSFDSKDAAVTYNATNNEYLVVWEGEDPAVGDNYIEIFGQRISNAGSSLGANFRISQRSVASTAFDALQPDVVWNSILNEYMVVYNADFASSGDEEVFRSRISNSGGVIDFDVQISNMTPAGGSTFDGENPTIAYNATNNEYLVVWEGTVASGEEEIFGQLLSSVGAEIGSDDFRISTHGTDGVDSNSDGLVPQIVWNSYENKYLITWQGDAVAGEEEIFIAEYDADGSIAQAQTRISHVGTDGDVLMSAQKPVVAYGRLSGDYLVAFEADGTTGLINNEEEIHVQLIGAAAIPPPPVTNNAPVISAIINQTTCENTAIENLAFSVTDADSDVLTVIGTSSDTTLVPNENIVFSTNGNTKESRSVNITPATDAVGSTVITLIVDDANGGTDTANFTVTVAANPTVGFTALADLCVNAGVQTGLGGGTPTGGVYTGSGVTDDGNGQTYTLDPGAAGVATHTLTYSFTNGSGCSSSSNDSVTVNGLDDASFSYSASAYCANASDPTPTITGLGGGTFSSTTGLSISESTGIIDVSESTSGSYTVTYTTTGACSTSSNVNITIGDEINPTVVLKSISATLDGSGSVTILASSLDSLSSDNCGIASYEFVPTESETQFGKSGGATSKTFTCSDLGSQLVEIRVVDINGNSTIGSTTITIVDQIAPTVLLKNISATLDASGNVTVNASSLDSASADNCSIAFFEFGTNEVGTEFAKGGPATSTTFTCADIGNQSVTIKVVDVAGNITTGFATVSIIDNTAPTVVLKNISVALDNNGSATVLASALDSASTDNCGIDSFEFTELEAGNEFGKLGGAASKTYTCDNVGNHTVAIKVIDASGNSNVGIASITVVDNVGPIVALKNINVQLDANGSATVLASALDSLSSDNCAIATFEFATVIETATIAKGGLATSKTFTCSDLGNQLVNIRVTDNHGNSNIGSANITIVDQIAPSVLLKNITAVLDVTGNVTVNASALDSASADNCSVDYFVFETNVTGTEFAKARGATSKTFSCNDIGTESVTITVFDASGNMTFGTANITVVDQTPPALLLKNISVSLDNTGSATVLASALDSLTTDNCGIASFEFTELEDGGEFGKAGGTTSATFTCLDLGANAVQIKATDASGNSSIGSALITIVDEIAPSVVLKNITVALDSTGSTTVLASALDSASSDNCAIATFEYVTNLESGFLGKAGLNASRTFSCTNIGTQLVDVRVTDVGGNSSLGQASITIVDETPPNVILKNISAVLDVNGIVSVAASSLDSLSTDACGINSFVFQSEILNRGETHGASKTFTCENVGDNDVIIIVSDGSGNISSQSANISILDQTAPQVLLKDISVDLDNTGSVSVNASALDSLSSDACGIASFGFVDVVINGAKNGIEGDSVKVFTCNEVGANIVQIAVKDVNGNVAYAHATITVNDVTAPEVVLKNITVALDSIGVASVRASDLDSASTDACGGLSFYFANLGEQEGIAKAGGLEFQKFYCHNLGENTLSVFVRDVNNQVSVGTAIVTVVDNIAPTPVLKNITVSLDSTGLVTVNSGDVDSRSSDNCSVVAVEFTDRSDDRGGLETTDLTFNCSQVGENVVGVTLTDQSGNQSAEEVTITILDDIAPIVYLKNLSTFLNVNGQVTIDASDLDSASFDGCGIEKFTIQKEQFLEVNRIGADSIITFNCNDVGQNRVTIGVYDVNGNVSYGTTTITIQDLTRPSVSLQDIAVQLDATGNVTVLASALDSASFDACGIQGFYFGGIEDAGNSRDLGNSELSFDCNSVGENEVLIEVVDFYGNRSAGSATITVSDVTASTTMLKRNISVNLDGNGQVTVLASNMDSASFDACGIAGFYFDENIDLAVGKDLFRDTAITFTCEDVGENILNVLVTDVNGNESSNTVSITVNDIIGPVLAVKNITAELGLDGTVTINARSFDNGSSDACGIDEFRFVSEGTPKAGPSADSIRVFDCAQIGINEVGILVADVNGNKSVINATVDVIDVIKPTALAKNITVYLDENGANNISPKDVDNQSYDNCGIKSMSVFPSEFSCIDTKLEAVEVTLTIADSAGNISTAIAYVTVLDTLSEIAALVQGNDVCETLDIQLVGSPAATHTWTGPNNFSSNLQSPLLSQVTVLHAGVYYLQVISENGCTLKDSVEVLVRPKPIIFLNHLANVSCYEESDGAIDVAVNAGTGFIYNWSNGAKTEDLSGVGNGVYTLTASNEQGCITESEAFTIVQPKELVITGAATDVSCNQVQDGLILTEVTGGNGDNSYTWTKGGNYFANDSNIFNLTGGTYKLQVVDGKGCEALKEFEVFEPNVLEVELYSPTLFKEYNVSGFGLSDGSIYTKISGGNGNYEILWSNGSTNDSLIKVPSGLYTITVSDSIGCSAERLIFLSQPGDLLFATALSPNGDNKNDNFVIKGAEGMIGNKITILDQFGTIVYKGNNYKNDWNGLNLNGESVPDGTYFYLFKRPNGVENTGYITLKRQ